jgi:hypothetical protein
MTFGTPSWNSRIGVYALTTPDINLTPNLVSARIDSGNNFGPYKGGPELATATIVFYYRPGVSVPASIAVNKGIYIRNIDPSTAHNLFYGKIRDVNITATLDEATGEFGKTVRAFCTNIVADLNAISVRGISTSATTKNETWEQRLTNTLQPYFPAGTGFFPSTGSEAHIYRLVDNNVDGTLVDQVNLACDSVGATWQPSPADNTCYFYEKGIYPKTGILFTDEANYWNGSNRPANAVGPGVGYTQNVFYSDIDVSYDTRELVNRVNVTNVMPRNVILSAATPGVLLYKDPVTIRPQDQAVIEPTYQGQNATSITTYGVRAQNIQTNVYPYRTSDTESFYLRFNGYSDPGTEYRTEPSITCTNANIRFSNVTPETGTWCYDVVATANGSSYVLIVGDTGGYPLKVLPTSNANCWTLSWRTAQANARFTRGIQYLDSNGNVLSTQSGTTNAPTLNTWTSQGGVIMDYTTIPAGTVAWRPIFTVTHSSGNFTVGTTIAKLDNFQLNPDMQAVGSSFTGDTADTSGNVYGWESLPGISWSYQQRNVLDNIATDVLTYWKDNTLKPRFLRWNLRLNYFAGAIRPLCRVDIRFNGANYVAFINSYTIDITQDDCIISAELGYRPSSWN